MDSISNNSNKYKPDVLLFSVQISIIFIVVCVSLMNLTMQWGNVNMWTVILTGSLGYIMPNPRLKAVKDKIEEVRETETRL